jgi:hypothetical protein
MSGIIHPPSNTPSWRGAQLKHRDNFTFYVFSYIMASYVFVLVTFWVLLRETYLELERYSRFSPRFSGQKNNVSEDNTASIFTTKETLSSYHTTWRHVPEVVDLERSESRFCVLNINFVIFERRAPCNFGNSFRETEHRESTNILQVSELLQ